MKFCSHKRVAAGIIVCALLFSSTGHALPLWQKCVQAFKDYKRRKETKRFLESLDTTTPYGKTIIDYYDLRENMSARFEELTFEAPLEKVSEGQGANTTGHQLYTSTLDGRKVHLKTYNIESEGKVSHEMAMLKLLEDRGVQTVPLLGYSRLEDGRIAMVTEFVEGSLVKKVMNPRTNRFQISAIKQRTGGRAGLIGKQAESQVQNAIDQLSESEAIYPDDLQFIVSPEGGAYLLDTGNFDFRRDVSEKGQSIYDSYGQQYKNFFDSYFRGHNGKIREESSGFDPAGDLGLNAFNFAKEFPFRKGDEIPFVSFSGNHRRYVFKGVRKYEDGNQFIIFQTPERKNVLVKSWKVNPEKLGGLQIDFSKFSAGQNISFKHLRLGDQVEGSFVRYVEDAMESYVVVKDPRTQKEKRVLAIHIDPEGF